MHQTLIVTTMFLSFAAGGAFAAEVGGQARIDVDCSALTARQIGQMTRLEGQVQLQVIGDLIQACPGNVDAIIAAAIDASPEDAELIVSYVTEQLPSAAGPVAADGGNLFTPGNSGASNTSNPVPSPGSGGRSDRTPGGSGSSGPVASAS
jgi:hypothetical protein